MDHEKEVFININGGADEEGAPDSEGGVARCLTSIEKKISLISPETQGYGTLCIYRVPEKHRNKNQEAYAPQLISIGLVHHGEPKLKPMEDYKVKCLKNFFDTFKVTSEELVEHMYGKGKLVCGCYEDIYVQNVLQQSKDPYEVILLDGIFILELFLKNYFVKLREKGDMVFDNIMVSKEILHDLLLFENQLPYRFLNSLYHTFVGSKEQTILHDEPTPLPPFHKLVHKYFRNVGNTGKLSLRDIDFQHARHFVEFLSILHMPQDRERSRENRMREINMKAVKKKVDFSKCPTATALRAVGVEFKRGTESNCPLDVKFDTKTGVLRIPPLTVNNFTETFFRNLIAFEQSGYYSKYTTSFVMLLDNLVDTAKDVDILIKHEIIKNELAGSEQVADLCNTLFKEFLADPKEFYFAEECSQLNDYSRHRWHKLKAEMGTWTASMWAKYFNTPWSFCSLIAAVTVLALTAIQTSYAIKTYYRGH